MQESRLDTVKQDFIKYLISLGVSQKSLKNYRSDINHFLAWMILKLRFGGTYIQNLTECIPFLSSQTLKDYKLYLQKNSTPVKTINRRLSSTRHLSKFLFSSGLISINISQGLDNIALRSKRPKTHPLISPFKAQLEAEKVSPNTIKNYLSDIRQFISWYEAREVKK